jgi:hypothetical protein
MRWATASASKGTPVTTAPSSTKIAILYVVTAVTDLVQQIVNHVFRTLIGQEGCVSVIPTMPELTAQYFFLNVQINVPSAMDLGSANVFDAWSTLRKIYMEPASVIHSGMVINARNLEVIVHINEMGRVA